PTEVGNRSLLRVELDDQLFLHRHLDLRALGKLVHENPEIRRHDLQPRRNRAFTQRFLRSDERQCLQRLRTNVDDVELRHPVAGDVDLLAVDEEVAVADQLTGLTTGPRKTSAVHDVVAPRFQELKQVVTGLSGAPRSFLVVAPELALEDAVGGAGRRLLLQMQQVFAYLPPPPALLAGRVGAPFERLVVADEVNLEPARDTSRGAGVSSHVFLLLPVLSDPAPLRRTAAVVRLRGHVLDGADLESCGLQ